MARKVLTDETIEVQHDNMSILSEAVPVGI